MPSPREDATLQRIRADVDATGWHVIRILEEPGEPRWAFTVGLHQSFGHPEIIVFGLPGETAHGVLNVVGELVASGATFLTGERSAEVLEGVPVEFRRVRADEVARWAGAAVRFYGGADVPLLQLFWPDRDGRFPWESEDGAGRSPETTQLRLDLDAEE